MHVETEKSKKSSSGFNLKLKSYILYLMLKFSTNVNIPKQIHFIYAPNRYFIFTLVTVSKYSEDKSVFMTGFHRDPHTELKYTCTPS